MNYFKSLCVVGIHVFHSLFLVYFIYCSKGNISGILLECEVEGSVVIRRCGHGQQTWYLLLCPPPHTASSVCFVNSSICFLKIIDRLSAIRSEVSAADWAAIAVFTSFSFKVNFLFARSRDTLAHSYSFWRMASWERMLLWNQFFDAKIN